MREKGGLTQAARDSEAQEEVVTLQCLYAAHDGVLVFRRKLGGTRLPLRGSEEAGNSAETEKGSSSPPRSSGNAQNAASDEVQAEPRETPVCQAEGRASEKASGAEDCHVDEQVPSAAAADNDEDGGRGEEPNSKAQTEDAPLRRFAKSRYGVSFYNAYASRREKDIQFVSRRPSKQASLNRGATDSATTTGQTDSVNAASAPSPLQRSRAACHPWPAFAANLCLEELRALKALFPKRTPQNIHGMLLPLP